MNRTLVLLIVVVIVLVLLIAIIYLMNSYPAMFISWRHDREWLPNIGAPFLTEAEADEIAEKVEKMPIRWVNSTLGTLGTASYIDDPGTHRREAAKNNKMLRGAFPGLYDKLLKYLNRRFTGGMIGDKAENIGNEEVVPRWVYPPRRHGIALPGIHVFAGNSLLARGWPVASVHIDKQEERCPLPHDEASFDFTRTYSFTIPITVPKGMGLYVIDAKEKDRPIWQPLWWALRGKIMQKINYRKGYMYLHLGKYFHCIAPFYAKRRPGSSKYESRITIQGHAVLNTSRNEYWVYW